MIVVSFVVGDEGAETNTSGMTADVLLKLHDQHTCVDDEDAAILVVHTQLKKIDRKRMINQSFRSLSG